MEKRVNVLHLPLFLRTVASIFVLITIMLTAGAFSQSRLQLLSVAAAGEPVTMVTKAGARAFQGPGEQYALLAIYSEGITVTINGKSSDASWFVVDLTAYNEGWMKVDQLTYSIDLESLPVVPTPQMLVTVTPQLLPALTLRLSSGVYASEYGSWALINIEAISREPSTKIQIEVMRADGKTFWRKSAFTDEAGFYRGSFAKVTQGVYTVRVTDEAGNTIQSQIKVFVGPKPSPTPKK